MSLEVTPYRLAANSGFELVPDLAKVHDQFQLGALATNQKILIHFLGLEW